MHFRYAPSTCCLRGLRYRLTGFLFLFVRYAHTYHVWVTPGTRVRRMMHPVVNHQHFGTHLIPVCTQTAPGNVRPNAESTEKRVIRIRICAFVVSPGSVTCPWQKRGARRRKMNQQREETTSRTVKQMTAALPQRRPSQGLKRHPLSWHQSLPRPVALCVTRTDSWN